MATSIAYATLPDNYIYISHLEEGHQYWILPSYPDSIQDSMESTFTQTNALSRSAPVWTYNYSGPRTVQITLNLHRDMMDDVNKNASNVNLEIGEDYIDNLIKALQSISVPEYNFKNKAVEVPLVAVRLGNEIFIKGIVTGTISVTYSKPILMNNKYAFVDVAFTISEVDPYNASTIFKNGSFRGLTRTMKKGMGMGD